MRAVIQRVSSASVTIGGAVKSSIGPGLLVLVAVEDTDISEDIDWLVGKLVRLRIFNDEQGLMNRSVQETGGEILVVSQFTLFASTNKCLGTSSHYRSWRAPGRVTDRPTSARPDPK